MDIDLNADLGEGLLTDADLMPLITSANVACGFHAGDPATASATIQLAVKHGVQVGAHPGFPDREHFGRRELQKSEQQIFEDCVDQIGAACGLARAAGTMIRHIKPHGALYNMACRDDAYARPIVRAAAVFGLPLVGLPESRLEALALGTCNFVREAFADRRYLADGRLVPRSEPSAFVDDPDDAVRQVQRLMHEQQVRTICVHGDNPRALEFVQALRNALIAAGHQITPFAVS